MPDTFTLLIVYSLYADWFETDAAHSLATLFPEFEERMGELGLVGQKSRGLRVAYQMELFNEIEKQLRVSCREAMHRLPRLEADAKDYILAMMEKKPTDNHDGIIRDHLREKEWRLRMRQEQFRISKEKTRRRMPKKAVRDAAEAIVMDEIEHSIRKGEVK
jgi:hypothetical protein